MDFNLGKEEEIPFVLHFAKQRILFTQSKICHSLHHVIDFTITLENFARSLRDRDRLNRATLTGLDLEIEHS